MRYKHFKNANVDVSELAVGTWAIGESGRYGNVNRNDAIEAIQVALDGGVNLIDTAPCYGTGASEKIVGEAIQHFDRSKLLIATKCGLVPYASPVTRGNMRDASYKNIMREIQTSLNLLGTDYIDFYFIHWPDPATDIAETMSALNVLKKRGYIRYIGLSNFNEEQILAAEEWGQVDVIQPPYSMVNRRDEKLMKWAYEKGINSLTYGSLGSGILTGAYREIPKFENERDIRNTFYDFFKEPKFSRVMELLKVMDEIAEAHNKPVAQVAINWSTQQDFVGTALCGLSNVKEAQENCATFDWSLTDEEFDRLNKKLDELAIG